MLSLWVITKAFIAAGFEKKSYSSITLIVELEKANEEVFLNLHEKETLATKNRLIIIILESPYSECNSSRRLQMILTLAHLRNSSQI